MGQVNTVASFASLIVQIIVAAGLFSAILVIQQIADNMITQEDLNSAVLAAMANADKANAQAINKVTAMVEDMQTQLTTLAKNEEKISIIGMGELEAQIRNLDKSITAAKLKNDSVYEERFAKARQGFTVGAELNRVKAGTDLVIKGQCDHPNDGLQIMVESDSWYRVWKKAVLDETCDSLAKYKINIPIDADAPEGTYWVVASSNYKVLMIKIAVTD